MLFRADIAVCTTTPIAFPDELTLANYENTPLAALAKCLLLKGSRRYAVIRLRRYAVYSSYTFLCMTTTALYKHARVKIA